MENTSTDTGSVESTDTGTQEAQGTGSIEGFNEGDTIPTQENGYDQDYKDDFNVNTEGSQEDNQYSEDNQEYSDEDVNSAMMEYLRENYELPDKFQDVGALINSYKHLEQKQGNLKGAPETYELQEDVFDNYDEGVLEGVVGVAQEMGIDNDGLNNILSAAMNAQNKTQEANWEMEKGKLGNNADQQIANTLQRLNANYPPEVSEQLQSMVQTAEQYRALETIINGNQQSAPAPAMQGQTQTSDNDLQKMLSAKDSFGNPRIETDPAYEAKVRNLMNQQWG